MLPTALLKELYDEHITRDEFERLSTVPEGNDSVYNPYRPLKECLTITAPKPAPCMPQLTMPVPVPMQDDNISSISTLSCSPTDNPVSYWQDLEVYSSTSSDEENCSKSSSSWSSGISVDTKKLYHSNTSTSTTKTQYVRRSKSYEVKKYCSFCFHNRETETVYTSHDLRDEAKNITCPALFEVVCRFCGSTGTDAHTPKYCPHKSFGQRTFFNNLA